MTIPKAVIGFFFLCSFIVSMLSGSVFHYDGVFPFPSWSLFSSFQRFEQGIDIEIAGPDFGPCPIETCPFKNRSEMLFIYIRDGANVIARKAGPEAKTAKDIQEKLSFLAGRPVGFRIYAYQIDMKDLSRDLAGKKMVFEFPVAP